MDESARVRVLAAEIAEKLMAENHFATLNGTDEVLVYREGVYEEGGEAYIKQLIQRNIQPSSEVTKHLVVETIGHVQRSTLVKREIFFEPSPYLVLRNGLLSTESEHLEPHTPDFYSLSRLPISFIPGQDCPKFRKFLGEVLYAEDIPVVQEWMGYCLCRGYPAQVAILFVGEGNNGKSTLIFVIQSLLGRENISAVSLHELELNRFAKADLFGKLANLYADLSDSAIQSVGTFKMLTGGDPIRGEKKFQNSFTFINGAKLTFSCNVVPEVYEDTTAFFRRWIIIQFPNSFNGDKADKNLLEKLTTPEELSGVLNFALEGLYRLRANGWTFSNSRSTADVRQDYIRRSSPMKAFLMDCTSLKSDGVTAKRDLFQAFVDYCQKMKLATVTSDTFYKNLPLYFAGHPLQESREDVDGKGRRVNCFRGIKLRPEADWGTPVPEEPEEGLKEREY
ncbi:MAG: phage/plasmid primase, P4 family [Nitrososphaerales archaeon]|jgi:putative DNA primase/helicase